MEVHDAEWGFKPVEPADGDLRLLNQGVGPVVVGQDRDSARARQARRRKAKLSNDYSRQLEEQLKARSRAQATKGENSGVTIRTNNGEIFVNLNWDEAQRIAATNADVPLTADEWLAAARKLDDKARITEQPGLIKSVAVNRPRFDVTDTLSRFLTAFIPGTDRPRYLEEFRAETYDMRQERVAWYRRMAYTCRLVIFVPYLAVTLRLTPKRARE